MKNRTINSILLAFLVSGVLAANVSIARAQTGNPQGAARAPVSSTPDAASSPAGASAQSSPSPSPSPVPSPKVTHMAGHLELDEIVSVQVENFAEWAENNDATKLVPFINGRALRGNYPEEIHPDQNRLHFHLEITPETKEVWTDLLGEPRGAKRPVTFTVGLENQSPFDSEYDQGHEVLLTIISPFYGWVSLIVILFTLVLFLVLAIRTNIIREPGPDPGGGKLKPYNLGRTQMAFWFFLVYVSYMVIWLITGALDTITASLLGLMGISAGTALSEAMIDSSKDSAQGGQLQTLTAEKPALEQSISQMQVQLADTTDAATQDSLNKQLQESNTKLAQVNQQLETLTPSSSRGISCGFLQDILADASGYSFHRFQIFAWTIVLGIIFVSSVYNSLTMPEFSATLLGLMGLSSGTYIGFKFPEQKQ